MPRATRDMNREALIDSNAHQKGSCSLLTGNACTTVFVKLAQQLGAEGNSQNKEEVWHVVIQHHQQQAGHTTRDQRISGPTACHMGKAQNVAFPAFPPVANCWRRHACLSFWPHSQQICCLCCDAVRQMHMTDEALA